MTMQLWTQSLGGKMLIKLYEQCIIFNVSTHVVCQERLNGCARIGWQHYADKVQDRDMISNQTSTADTTHCVWPHAIRELGCKGLLASRDNVSDKEVGCPYPFCLVQTQSKLAVLYRGVIIVYLTSYPWSTFTRRT